MKELIFSPSEFAFGYSGCKRCYYDLKKDNLILANFKNVSSSVLCTKITNSKNISVSTIEHLLAAFYITGIDNVLIEIDNIEVPIMDGSAIDFVKKRMSGLLTPDVEEKVIGTAQILEIFKVSGAGKVAGSKVTDGEINSNSDVRVIRDGSIVFTGKVGSLFREKNQVKQVNNGQECGIALKDYMDFKKNDTIEAFSVTSKERTI